ncbi:uncharacterized protein LOC144300003 [Canis aureus]
MGNLNCCCCSDLAKRVVQELCDDTSEEEPPPTTLVISETSESDFFEVLLETLPQDRVYEEDLSIAKVASETRENDAPEDKVHWAWLLRNRAEEQGMPIAKVASQTSESGMRQVAQVADMSAVRTSS